MQLPIPTLYAALALLAPAALAQTAHEKPAVPAPVKAPRAEGENVRPAAPAGELPARTAPGARIEGFHPLQAGPVYREEPGGVWAAARGWKARFHAGGATFVPFFGSERPRNAPLELRTESIRVAGAELASAGAAVARSGDRIALERGAVDELWQLRADDAEQLFVIEQPLASGELVLRVAFEGEYEAELDEEGVLFRGEHGALRYGLAFAFDAAGRSTPVAERLDGAAIELTVPASFLAEAMYPVTVDPIVTVYPIEFSFEDTIRPDVAFEDATGSYLYVYEHVFSQTDSDVFSVLGGDQGIIQDSVTAIDASLVSWSRPRVASNLRAYGFLVVAEVGQPGTRQIRGRLVDAITGDPGPELQISDPVDGEHVRPDVGGDPNLGLGTRYCVVYERIWSPVDRDIHARLVDPETGVPSELLLLDNSGFTLDTKPAISNSCGLDDEGPAHWTVVWEREIAAQDHDVHGAQVAAGGTIHTSSFVIDASLDDDVDPAVSPLLDGGGTHRPYAVAWSRWEWPFQRDIRVAALIGNQKVGEFDLSLGQPLRQSDDATPQVETDGHLFAVAYAKEIAPQDSDIWVNWVYFADGLFTWFGAHETSGFALVDEIRPALVSKHSGGRASGRMALAFEIDYGSESDVWSSIVDAPEAAPVESICTGASFLCPCGSVGQHGGCSNSVNPLGGYLTHSGDARVSDDSLLLTGSGMPATAMCLFLQGTVALNDQQGVPFGDGLRCVGGSVIRLGTKLCFAGAAHYPGFGETPIAEKGQLSDLGGRRFYQVWYRDPAPHCTPATFNLSNALEVIWVP